MPPVDNSLPPVDDNMPPMDDMGNGQQGDEQQFDTNFDAGVDADENNDPKKYIQQLAGKLSQSLRKYNEGLPNPDTDLNKYVAGMTNDAAVEGLNPEEVEEIINKIKSDENSDNNNNNDNNSNQEAPQNNNDSVPPMDGNQDMNQTPDMPPMEGKKGQKIVENIESCIEEIVNDIISNKKVKMINDKISVKKSFKTKPYTPPMFK